MPTDLFDLSGRVAVVTGAASGLGQAMAIGLARHGADVACSADLRGTAHGVLLAGIFYQAHFVQRAAQVALLLGGERAVAHAGTQATQPTVYP